MKKSRMEGIGVFRQKEVVGNKKELKPHSYGENLLTCANLHMSKFAHVSKS